MIETIPIPVKNEIHSKHISKDSYSANLNLRITEIIKNSAFLIEKKSKSIMKELQNLKTEYLAQLQYISDYLTHKSNYKKITVKPHDNSMTKRGQENKNIHGEVKNVNIPLPSSFNNGYLEIFREPSSNNHNMTLNCKRRLINASGGFSNNNKNNTHKKNISDVSNIISTTTNSVIKKNQSPLQKNKSTYNNKSHNLNDSKNSKGIYRSVDKKFSNQLNLNLSDYSKKTTKKIEDDKEIPHFKYKIETNIKNTSGNSNNIFNNLMLIRDDRKFSITDIKSDLSKPHFLDLEVIDKSN
jgi:hypothetical protein